MARRKAAGAKRSRRAKRPSAGKRIRSGSSRCARVDLGRVIVLGKTPLRARYSRRGKGALIGYLDVGAGRLYVADPHAERVRWAIGGTVVDGGWAIQRGREVRVYMLEPIARLDLTRPMAGGDVAVMKDRKCVPYKKGTCINFYRGDKFAYSWMATDDTGICTPTDAETCAELPQQNPVTLYPKEDCKGTPYQSNETWNFCTPP